MVLRSRRIADLLRRRNGGLGSFSHGTGRDDGELASFFRRGLEDDPGRIGFVFPGSPGRRTEERWVRFSRTIDPTTRPDPISGWVRFPRTIGDAVGPGLLGGLGFVLPRGRRGPTRTGREVGFFGAADCGTTACVELGSFGKNGRTVANPSGGVAGGLVAVLQGFPFFPVIQDFAGGAGLELADDAVLGHEVDQAGGAAVADPEGPLEEGGRAPTALADDDLDGGLVELVAGLEGVAVLADSADLELGQLAAELLGELG